MTTIELTEVCHLIIDAMKANGFAVRFVDYCEDSLTPGLLGAGAGVTDRRNSEVKISTVVAAREGNLEDILWHELRHVENPRWDCGTGYIWMETS